MKVGVVLSTHRGDDRMHEWAQHIRSQSGWTGPLVVVHSGSLDSSSIAHACDETGIDFVVASGEIDGHAKRNFGAGLAAARGARWLAFPNDYQRFRSGSLANLQRELKEERSDAHVALRIGHVMNCNDRLFSGWRERLIPGAPLGNYWSYLSAVAEAGLIVRSDVFLRLGGWQYPQHKGRPVVGGDGLLLAARILHLGYHVATASAYVVEGGHSNPHNPHDVAQRKRASYPYAFSLASRHQGIPRSIALRFLIGRIGRGLESVARGEFGTARDTLHECAARAQGLLSLPVPKSALPGLRDYWTHLSADLRAQ